MEDAGTPLDGRDEEQEGEHGGLFEEGVGLEGLRRRGRKGGASACLDEYKSTGKGVWQYWSWQGSGVCETSAPTNLTSWIINGLGSLCSRAHPGTG